MHVRFFTHRKWCWTASLGKARQMLTSYPWRTQNNRTKWPQSRLRQVLELQSTMFPCDQIREWQKTPNKMEPKQVILTQARHRNAQQKQIFLIRNRLNEPEIKRRICPAAFYDFRWTSGLNVNYLRFFSTSLLSYWPPWFKRLKMLFSKDSVHWSLGSCGEKEGRWTTGGMHWSIDLDFLFVLNKQLWVQWRGLKLYYHNVYTMVHPDHVCTDSLRTGRPINLLLF